MPARRLGIFCGLVAAGIAGYLAFASWQTRGTPWGCGAGSGCEEVLRSRWSSLFGLPVSLLAVIVDLGLVLSLLTLPSRPGMKQVAVTLATGIFVAAVWFIGLQMFVLRAYCPWCLIDHAFAVTAAICAFLSWKSVDVAAGRDSAEEDLFDTRIPPRHARTLDDPFAEPPKGDRASLNKTAPGVLKPVVAGAAMAAVLILLQVAIGKPSGAIARLPQDANADTGPGESRAIAVLQGRLPLNVHELPLLGASDSRLLLVAMFDYCCPHCRDTHDALREALKSETHEPLGVILLPTPLNASCNPAIEETEPRFVDACELARLALAVWRAAPDQFSRFDAWLFEPELPRTAAEARAEASRLLGDAALARALADPWIENRIAANVTAYRDSEAGVLPILLSPGASAIVGRTDDSTELMRLLEQDFGWKAKPASQ